MRVTEGTTGGSSTWAREMTSFSWSEERSTELEEVVEDENRGELHHPLSEHYACYCSPKGEGRVCLPGGALCIDADRIP